MRLGAAAAASSTQKGGDLSDDNVGPNMMGQSCSDKRDGKKKRKTMFSLQDLLVKDTDTIKAKPKGKARKGAAASTKAT